MGRRARAPGRGGAVRHGRSGRQHCRTDRSSSRPPTGSTPTRPSGSSSSAASTLSRAVGALLRRPGVRVEVVVRGRPVARPVARRRGGRTRPSVLAHADLAPAEPPGGRVGRAVDAAGGSRSRCGTQFPWPTGLAVARPSPPRCRGRPPRRRLVQPGPRPRPRGRGPVAARSSPTAASPASTAWCRPRSVWRSRDRATGLRPARRPHLPPRRERPPRRPRRAVPRPHPRRRQRRRRRHLHDPRARGAGAGRRLRARLRHPDRHRPRGALPAHGIRHTSRPPRGLASPRSRSGPTASASSRSASTAPPTGRRTPTSGPRRAPRSPAAQRRRRTTGPISGSERSPCENAGVSETPQRTEVLVVGAGLRGLGSRWAARAGRDALADAAVFPRDKTCGDGLTPRAVAELDPSAWATGCASTRSTAACARTASARPPPPVARRLPPDHGSAVPRTELDDRIRTEAIARRHGRRGRQGRRRPRRERPGDRRDLPARRRDLRHRVRAPRRGRRRALGPGQGARPEWHKDTVYAVAGRCYVDSERSPTTRGSAATSSCAPRPARPCPATAGSSRSAGPGERRRRHARDDEAPADVAIKPLMKHYTDERRADFGLSGEQRMPTSALLPMGGAVSNVAGANWALIGDAAACVNPLNGEGIDYGLETGRLVVDALDTTSPHAGPPAARPLRRGVLHRPPLAGIFVRDPPRSARSACAATG